MCSEYGWSVEHCFAYTQEQIEILVEAIQKRKMNDLEVQAKLHGAEMKKETNKALNVDTDWNRIKRMSNVKEM